MHTDTRRSDVISTLQKTVKTTCAWKASLKLVGKAEIGTLVGGEVGGFMKFVFCPANESSHPGVLDCAGGMASI